MKAKDLFKDKGDKNIFTLLLLSTFISILLLAVLFILYQNDILYSKIVVIVSGLTLIFILLLGLSTTLALMLMWYEINVPRFFKKIVRLSIRLIFPIIVYIGSGINIKKEDISRLYTELNNRLVLGNSLTVDNNNILVLTPHCLQKSACPYKITYDISNCKRCGGCDVDDLLALREKYNHNFRIVTGGTVARKIIKETSPKIIIAIACERDLISGLQDISNIPVVAVVNQRPEGPCVNTKVDIKKVERAIKHFIKE